MKCIQSIPLLRPFEIVHFHNYNKMLLIQSTQIFVPLSDLFYIEPLMFLKVFRYSKDFYAPSALKNSISIFYNTFRSKTKIVYPQTLAYPHLLTYLLFLLYPSEFSYPLFLPAASEMIEYSLYLHKLYRSSILREEYLMIVHNNCMRWIYCYLMEKMNNANRLLDQITQKIEN